MFTTLSPTGLIDDLLTRICEELQITPGKHQEAEKRYNGVSDWLGAPDSPLSRFCPKIMAQGSLRIGTTVKPIAHNEFDLDLVCQLNIDWRNAGNPVALLNVVEGRLKAAGSRYSNLVERKNRCIRLNYANEFHMDILPACLHSDAGAGCVMIPDRAAKDWKPSNPTGYANWFESRAATLREVFAKAAEPLPEHESVDEKKPLKLAVQLIKRWRDIHYKSAPKVAPISIVLTTLAANAYKGELSLKDAMSGILNDIVAAIPPAGQRLVVFNPSTTNPREDFSERWDTEPGYNEFISGIKTFKRRWDELEQGRGIHISKQILVDLFGEPLYTVALQKQAEAMRKSADSGKSALHRGTGFIGALGSVYTQLTPRHTFYGN